MQGGTRDFVLLRTALSVACVALIAMIAAPAALAGSPAGDQYGSAIPGGGNGGSTSGASPSGGSPTEIPGGGRAQAAAPRRRSRWRVSPHRAHRAARATPAGPRSTPPVTVATAARLTALARATPRRATPRRRARAPAILRAR